MNYYNSGLYSGPTTAPVVTVPSGPLPSRPLSQDPIGANYQPNANIGNNAPGVIVEVQEERSAVIRMVSGLFYFIAIQTFFVSLMSVELLIYMNYLTGGTGFPDFYYLKFFPSFGSVPILFVIATLVFFFDATKVSDGSHSSWWGGVTSLFIIPPLLAFGLPFLVRSVLNLFMLPYIIEKSILPLPTFDPSAVTPLFYVFLFYDVILVVMFLFFNEYHYESTPLHEKQVSRLGYSALFYGLPVFLFILYAYGRSYGADIIIWNTQRTVSYSLITAKTFIPGLRTYLTNITTGRELAGTLTATQLIYTIYQPSASLQDRPIHANVKQAKVQSNFLLSEFVKLLSPDPYAVQVDFHEHAQSNKIFLVTTKMARYAVYLTMDNVLVLLTSSDATTKELLGFAGVLK